MQWQGFRAFSSVFVFLIIFVNKFSLSNIPNPESWGKIVLHIFQEGTSGAPMEMTLLRPHAWIKGIGAKVGARIFVEFSEQNFSGVALVKAIQPCPRISSGPGEIVMGTFHGLSHQVKTIHLQNSKTKIEATARHPLYSQTRKRWVAVEDLLDGEHLKTQDGFVAVDSIRTKPGQYRVYNLEVNATHNYYVSEQKILAHNNDCGVGLEAARNRRLRPAQEWLDTDVRLRPSQETIDRDIVADYLRKLKNGEKIDDPVLLDNFWGEYWVADGHHKLFAEALYWAKRNRSPRNPNRILDYDYVKEGFYWLGQGNHSFGGFGPWMRIPRFKDSMIRYQKANIKSIWPQYKNDARWLNVEAQ